MDWRDKVTKNCAAICAAALLLTGCNGKVDSGGGKETTLSQKEANPISNVAVAYLGGNVNYFSFIYGSSYYNPCTGILDGAGIVRLIDMDGDGTADVLCGNGGAGGYQNVGQYHHAFSTNWVDYTEEFTRDYYALATKDGEGYLLEMSTSGEGYRVLRCAPSEEVVLYYKNHGSGEYPNLVETLRFRAENGVWEVNGKSVSREEYEKARQDFQKDMDVEILWHSRSDESHYDSWVLERAAEAENGPLSVDEQVAASLRKTHEVLRKLSAAADMDLLAKDERLQKEQTDDYTREQYFIDAANAFPRDTYLCNSVEELGAEQLEALKTAALRCHYSYYLLGRNGMSGDNFKLSTACLLIYTPASYLTKESGGAWLSGNHYAVKMEDCDKFLYETFAPAYHSYQSLVRNGGDADWSIVGEELYINSFGLTATLIRPDQEECTSVEPLGNNRYLVLFDMTGAFVNYQLAMVVEDRSVEGEPLADHLRVLDCVIVNNEKDGQVERWTWDEYDAFIKFHRESAVEGCSIEVDWTPVLEAIDLTGQPGETVEEAPAAEETDGLPMSTEIADQLSEPMKTAMEEAANDWQMYVPQMANMNSMIVSLVSDKLQALYYDQGRGEKQELQVGRFMADAWNAYPVEDLNNLLMERFGIDLSDGKWLEDPAINQEGYYGRKYFSREGDLYWILTPGRGSSSSPIPKVASAQLTAEDTYQVLFRFDPDLDFGEAREPVELTLKNIGTETVPYFQLQLN